MRVVFATQRYWPAVSPSIACLDRLARGLVSLGQPGSEIATTVLTGQWENHWPLELLVRDVPVLRFPMQSWSLLGRSNLGSKIADWLSEHPDQWDVLVVFGTIEGGDNLFRVARELHKPAVIHLVETGPGTLFENRSLQNRIRKRFATWAAQPNWITTNSNSVTGLRNLNPEANIHRWDLGIESQTEMTLSERKELRLALVSTHPVLRGSRYLPLVVYDGPYGDDDDTIWLWRLLQQVCSRRRDFKVWLTGDGPGLSRLYHSIVADELEEQILIPGYFPDKTDLYATADLVIFPNSLETSSTNFLTSLSVYTPTIVSKEFLDRLQLAQKPEISGLARNWNLWTQAILEHLDNPKPLREQTKICLQDLIQNHSYSATLKSYLQILQSLEIP